MSKLTNNTTSLEQILEDLKTKATPSGGTNTSDATAIAADILAGKTAYVKGEKITGTIETKTSSNLTASGATVTVPAGYYASQATKSVSTATQATPSITVSSSGLITASATQTAGYVTAGTKTATKQLTTKAATTYTPGTSNQTIAASTYLTGIQTIKGDSNLVASNIKSGISIFGVTGTYTGSSSEDLTSEVNTYTAKITELETAITTLENELQGKASGGGGGASLETCTVTIVPKAPGVDRQVYYVNGNQELVNESLKMATLTITCIKKSIIYVSDSTYWSSTITGEASKLINHTIFVAGDTTVVIDG